MSNINLENLSNQKNLFSIKGINIAKRFNKHVLFKGLDLALHSGDSFAVTGPNGSGKSTLLEIIAGLRLPSKGKVEYFQNDYEFPKSRLNSMIGFSSFRVNPYNELTGLENVLFVVQDNKNEYSVRIEDLFKTFNLQGDKNKKVKHYSSGMKQRLRFLLAILRDPPVLFLDEPGANLDRNGKDIIYSYIKSQQKGKLIIIATNEEEEADLCNERIKLGS